MSMNNTSIRVPVYTEVDLVANAVYIYLLLLLSYIVFGLLGYGTREYLLSLKDRESSITSAKIAQSNWSPMVDDDVASETLDLEALGSFNKKPTRKYSFASMAVSIPNLGIRQQDPEADLRDGAKGDRESELMEEVDRFRKLEVIYDEVNSGESKTISEYLTETTANHSQKPTKTVYTMKALHEIDEEVRARQIVTFSHRNKQVKLSDILRFNTVAPVAITGSIYQNNKVIDDIKTDLVRNKDLDLASKSVSLLSLTLMGYKHDGQSNVNYFLGSFNELIEFVTDTGIYFELLEKITSDTLRESSVQVLLNYCWDHWNFTPDGPQPLVVQNRNTVFRIMCNLKLGITDIESFNASLRNRVNFRIEVLIREVTKRSRCNDYLEIIPMITQAIDLVDTVSLQYLFFDLLLVVVKTHGKCCMKEYLFDSKSDLKAIVQHGLWHKNDKKIVGKANEILQYLVSLNEQIYRWYSDISGGKIYVNSSGNNNSPLRKTEVPDIKPVTPGAWKIAKR